MSAFLSDFIKLDLTPAELSSIEDLIVTKHVKKGEQLVKVGDLVKGAFFVINGCLRSYLIDEKGKEHVFLFAPEGWILAERDDFKGDQIASLYVEAIENSTVEFIPLKVYEIILKLRPTSLEHQVPKLHKRIQMLQKRVILLMSASAKARYEYFLETYPSIVQRVPQKMIASYLGITPEALSKIKKDSLYKSGIS